MAAISDSLFEYDRGLGHRYVCGADESGFGAWAGPLVVAAVRFDYERLDAKAFARLERLYDSKKRSDAQIATLSPIIREVADETAVVVVSSTEIDEDGSVGISNRRAITQALDVVAIPGSVKLVDWVTIKDVEHPPRPVKDGDRTSAAIAAASILAKGTRDRLMRELDAKYPGYGFAAHHGYGGDETHAHTVALKKLGLSPVHRRSSRGCKPYLPRA